MNIRYLILPALVIASLAQAVSQTNANLEQGLKPYGSYDASKIDTVNLMNGNLTVAIPIISYPQRGSLHHNLVIVYNNKNWSVSEHCDLVNTEDCNSKWIAPAYPGAAPVWDDSIRVEHSTDQHGNWLYSVKDYLGSSHPLAQAEADSQHSGNKLFRALDGSGYTFSTDVLSNATLVGHWYDPTYLWDKHGNLLNTIETDPNGNTITTDANNNVSDTLNRSFPQNNGSASDTAGCVGPRPVTSASIQSLPGPNGGTAQIKTCVASVILSTNFRAKDEYNNAIQESGPRTTSVIQSYILYDGVSWATSPQWTFEYADNDDGTNYGDLTKITLPTGGTISYTWGMTDPCPSYITQPPGWTPESRGVTTRTVDANDGLGPQTWTYGGGPFLQPPAFNVGVTDPVGNQVIHTFDTQGSTYSLCNYYETNTQSYGKSGDLLKTEATHYTSIDTGLLDSGGVPIIGAVFPDVITTTLPNGKVSQIQRDYVDSDGSTGTAAFKSILDGITRKISFGNVIEERVYDYGNGSAGSLLKKTHYTYKAFQDTGFLSANFLDRVASVTVYNGSGGQVAQTTYGYDEFGLEPSRIPAGPYLVSAPALRGNQTSVTKWVGPGTVQSTTTYYDSGMPYQATDFGVHTTTYSYSSAYLGAYVTQTQMPDTHSPNTAHHAVSGTYDFNTGLLSSFTDQNVGSSYYYYDGLARLTSASFPDGGGATLSYPNLNTVELKKKIDSSRWTDQYAVFDGVGRAIRKLSFNDQSPNSWDQTDTCYYGDGTVQFKSHVYQGTGLSTSRICSGAGDTFTYDGLQRVTQVLHADGSHSDTVYIGRAARTTDEGNGSGNVVKVAQSDVLGRLRSVCEVTSIGLSGIGGTPAACGQDDAQTGFLTSYDYDGLGNLKSVNQGGYAARSFVYDGLSRLTSATNPESGTVNYTYTSDGQVLTRKRPQPNQTNPAQIVTTTYSYDELHRQRTISYDDGVTPTATFNYDESSVAGHSAGPSVGYLTSEYTNKTGTYFWDFDPMGRVKGRSQCTPRTCPNSSYYDFTSTYDYLGDPLTVGLPSLPSQGSITLTNTYNGAPRLTSVASSLSDTNHPGLLLSNVQYGAFGVTSATIGGLVSESLTYAPRGWLSGASDIAATTPQGGSGTVTVSGSESSRQIVTAIATKSTGNVTINGTLQSKQVLVQNAVAGSGSVSISGSELTWQAQTAVATQATGSVTISGSLQSKQVQTAAATSGSATITIGGSTQSVTVNMCNPNSPPYNCPVTMYNAGSIYLVINGNSYSGGYGGTMTSNQIATSLANNINGGSLAYATVSGGTITVTARATGASTNYSLSTSCTYNTQYFSSCGWYASAPGPLSGGKDATYTTVYDSGATSITVNGQTLSTSWSGSGTSASSIASALGSTLNSSSPYVTASVSGTTIYLTSRQTGASTNYSLTSGSSFDSGNFSSGSFSTSNSGGALTGGKDAQYTTNYDSGTTTVTVNGHATSYSWAGSSSFTPTPSTIATGVAQAINGDGSAFVNAVSSGSSVTLTARSTGPSTNYSLGTYTSSFTQGFSSSASGGSLTGGIDAGYNTVYDSGSTSITINGETYSASWSGSGTTNSSIASALADAVSSPQRAPNGFYYPSLVIASASGSTVYLTSRYTGASTNYSLSASSTYDSGNFSTASFTTAPSGTALTGGKDETYTTVYDTGTLSVTVNGYTRQVSYGQSDTPSSLASSLSSAFNGDSNSPVTANASGGNLTLTSKQTGTSSNYAFSTPAQTTSDYFSGTSFMASPSSGALNGGMSSQTAVYAFTIPQSGGFAPNGDILQVNDSVNGNWTYTYDGFNRLLTAVTSSGPNSGIGCSWVYDRFGNRMQQIPNNGNCLQDLKTFSGGNNRIDGASYDAVGNLLLNPNTGSSYTYDAEGRISIASGGYSYIYDAEGRRVAKLQSGAITNEYLLEGPSQVIELDGSGNGVHTNVYAGGNLLATYQGGQTQFHFSDWLGSRRVQLNALGQITESCTNYPFGDGLSCSGSDATEHHFTGKERDSETGLDYFGARYYGSSMGRWMSPDWAAKATAVPYADFGNPQSLNLYGYVGNNPLSKTDPDGHCAEAISCSIEFGTGGSFFGGPVGGIAGAVIGAGVGLYVEYRIAKWASNHLQNSNSNKPANTQTNTQTGQSTPADPNKKDGGAKKTEHGEQRANEAREGDAHRDVGDVNRTIRDGQQYTDTDTGNNVSVRGNRVVITNEDGDVVSQFKNTKANTQQRIDDGRWVPKPKPETH